MLGDLLAEHVVQLRGSPRLSGRVGVEVAAGEFGQRPHAAGGRGHTLGMPSGKFSQSEIGEGFHPVRVTASRGV